MKVEVVTYYGEEDLDFTGDYAYKYVYVNGELALSCLDEYHDHSSAKVKGFVEGLAFACGPLDVVYTNKSELEM